MAILTKDDQERIESVIQNLQMQLGLPYPENSLVDLAHAAGVEILEVDLGQLRPGVSGLIVYADEDLKTDPVIFLNTDMTPERSRFTIAHELGHHFLHTGGKWRVDVMNYAEDSDEVKEESEANYFAASLLVPRHLLDYELTKKTSIAKLAEFFGVSIPVIQNRLRWLGVSDF